MSSPSSPSPSTSPTLAPALARGLLRLLTSPGRSLPEGRLLDACGRGRPRGKLREGLGELLDAGLLERIQKGRGARWTLPESGVPAVLERLGRDLSPRARLSGRDVLGLLALLGGEGAESGEQDVPSPGAPGEPPVFPPPSFEDNLYTTIFSLCRSSPMVKILDLARTMGVATVSELARSLDKLERARAIQLDPLSDPRVVPEDERSQGISDPYRGLLFYVSIPPEPRSGT